MAEVNPIEPISPYPLASATSTIKRDVRNAVSLSLTVFALAWVATHYGSGADEGVAAVWPVDAVVLVALLRSPLRKWPLLMFAAAMGDFACSLIPLAAWKAQLGLACCDVMESTVAAMALRRIIGPGMDLSKRWHLVVFVAVALGSAVASSLPASLVYLLAHGAPIASTVPSWVLGDTLGLVVVAPALLAMRAGELKTIFSPEKRLRTALVLGGEVAIIAAVCIVNEPTLKSLILPALMLTAIDLGMTGAAIGVLLGGATMIGLTSISPELAHAPLSVLQHAVDIVQIFIAVAAVATLGLAATMADRRRLQLLVEEVAQQFQVLTENANDLVSACGLNGRFEYVSPACRDMTGYDPGELMGRRVLSFVHPEDRAKLIVELRRVLRGDRGERVQFRALCKDGGVIWVEGRPRLRRDPVSGAIVGITDVTRDITARCAMEEELERKRAEAEAAVIAKAEFLANMSHEIRTPLTGIIGFANLLEKIEDLPPTAVKYVDYVVTAGRTLRAVVNDILDFSKIEAGQLELDPAPFDPAGFVRETLELAAVQAQGKGLTLTCEIADDMPGHVLADSSRIRQVLLNLIGNAVKFTALGGVAVRARYLWGDPGHLRIEVADTGAGIPAAKLGRLFERFSQVDGSISRHYGGTGLGLVISKTLTEMMGGQIGVQSLEGQGSTFWFTVAAPLAQRPAPALAPHPADQAVSPARILVVDDVAANRILVRAMLSACGHLLTEAAHGQEAVELARVQSFDLILMDLQMPGMDGLAATRAIRAGQGANRDTPIVALSANALGAHVAECAAAGMNDHIAKPIDPATLLTKVARWSSAAEDTPHSEVA
jgi:PAS domain S-box-containing protein